MLLAVHPTQIVLIALGLFVVSFALYSLLASETGMRFGVYWGVSCRILRRHGDVERRGVAQATACCGRRFNMHTRVALVTGASRGIGRAIAVELARAGFAVGVNYVHRLDQAEETVAAITAGGGEASTLQADVADSQAVEAMFATLDRRFGRLDALVNNAGVGTRIESLTDIDDATWRRTLAVNLDGAFYCIRAAVPRLQAAGGGRIVNISSGAAKTGGMIGAHYAASKAGLLALTAKAARELAREGIAVTAVLPSVIETEMLDALAGSPEARERLRAQFPIGRFGRPEEVAQVVRFLIAEAPSYLTGEFVSLRGGRL